MKKKKNKKLWRSLDLSLYFLNTFIILVEKFVSLIEMLDVILSCVF